SPRQPLRPRCLRPRRRLRAAARGGLDLASLQRRGRGHQCGRDPVRRTPSGRAARAIRWASGPWMPRRRIGGQLTAVDDNERSWPRLRQLDKRRRQGASGVQLEPPGFL
ncbi:unnamed protein product, partial [Prorocentrum cordatum]